MKYKSNIDIPDVAASIEELKRHKGPVFIFGTGNYGAMALYSLKKHGIKIHGFCDNNKLNWGTDFHGVKVNSPKILLQQDSDTIVLIASLRFRYMKRQLAESRNIRTMLCDFLFSKLDLSGIDVKTPIERLLWMLDLYIFSTDADRDEKKLKVNSLDIVVTEKCSLRCRNCSNLMQYYQKPKDWDVNEVIPAIDRFMRNVDKLHEARVIGGEPFMYRNWADVVHRISSYDNCDKVTIFTNGTIVPKDDVLKSIRGEKLSMIISDYGTISKNLSRLKDALIRVGIPFIIYEIEYWQDCSSIQFRHRGEKELENLFGDCCVNDTLTLLNGRLYTCPFAAHVNNLNAVPIKYRDEFVDLNDSNEINLKNRIRALLSVENCLKACYFCAGRNYDAERIEVALQADKPISFKHYEVNSGI
jgi:hypothetical protein